MMNFDLSKSKSDLYFDEKKKDEGKYFICGDLLPAFRTNNIAIVFETSELYAPYLDPAIRSIVETSQNNYNYDIIVLSHEIEAFDILRLRDIVNRNPNFSIRFFDPHDIVKRYIVNAKRKYLEINYYRMALPWILPNYDKVINLGSDLIVLKDLHFLFDINIEDYCIGGCKDLGWQGRLKIDIPQSELDLKFPYSYINADVLLFNLKKIRNEYSIDQLLLYWQKKQLRCSEQDALNKIFDGNILNIDLRWNIFPDRMTSEYHISYANDEDIDIWKEGLKSPYIVHFAAVPKAWNFPDVGFGDQWWKYARKSLYYEEFIRRMCITETLNSINSMNNSRKIKNRVKSIGNKLFPKGSRRRIFIKKYILRKKG